MPLRLDVAGEGSGSPSTRLFTRRSLKLARKLSSRPEKTDEANSLEEISGRESVAFSAPRVPMEVLEHIVDLFVEEALAHTANNLYPNTQKTAFKVFVQECALVSRDFRFLVLRRFFQSLVFTTTKESRALFNYLADVDLYYMKRPTTAYSWVRSLKSPSFLLPVSMKGLSRLTRLEHVSIDFTHSGLTLQCTCVAKTFETIGLPNIVCSLTSITLTNLPRIDIHLVTLISECFPALTSVHVSSTEGLDTCCPSCYENSLSQIVHSPIPDLCADIDALASAFGTSLAPLKKLTHLFLGLFLSHPDLLHQHIEHSPDDTNMAQISLGTIFRCLHCKEHRYATKRKELKASLLLSQHLESLEYIGWSSCFGMSASEGQTKENVLEGVSRYTDGRDLIFNSPPTRAADEDTNQTLSTSTYVRRDLTTALKIHRLTDRIKVIRFL